MVTFAQAQERAERWVNGSVPDKLHREVRVREFDLGFVAWAESRPDAPASGGKLVIARDSGDTTLWPALPVGEVIRQYEEEYGSPQQAAPASEPAQRVDLEATSFLLTPPQWLQDAADRAGVPDHRPGARNTPGTPPPAPAPAGSAAAGTSGPVPVPAQQTTGPEGRDAAADPPVAPAAAESSPWDSADTSDSASDDASVAPPATVFSPPLAEPGPGTPPPGEQSSEARTALLPQGSVLPRTAVHPAVPDPSVTPGSPGPRGAADLADADTAKAFGLTPPKAPGAPAATPSAPGSRGPTVPPPPGAPGAPGAKPSPARDGSGSDASGYVPTQMVSASELKSQLPQAGSGAGRGPGTPPPPPAPESPSAGPRTPPPPGAQGGGVHQAATMLAQPGVTLPPTAPPPGTATPPPGPAAPAPGAATPPPPGAYGYPQQPDRPTVGSGYMAVLRFRAPDGSEQRLIRRSAPGLPHPEWQLLHELHGMGVPPQQVLELHTELQSCELPGGYCARMVRETWPQVRITHTAAYGQELAGRQAGVRHLVEHQDELEQFADGPPRAAPVRAPLPQQQPAPAVGLDVIGQELAQAYGPQGVFRYDQQAVSRQGVPEIVAHTLVWAGVPLEIGPFFWAQAQPGRPVPTLAELAVERGIQPAPDAGSYLALGNDFGRQLCVQYGTACIVAVPLEAGPGGQVVPPQFVNASLPQFVRCMALLGRMWRLRYGLNQEQAGRWTTDFQAQLASLDPQALADPESWWSVLLEQMWDGLL
ncbi:SUKH-4 family immunity protein [Streptomyces sp. ACA25]|uniref:SUKH-4 family immunity protein n=1 Tax=Streptomyces sp. ACA25 TaxID=3022596 RepID=UPI0023075CBF|nr:SUKH-4 family immunity protein [Streptomyces sp. ACA25]MDB1087232.1 SUKH-4 family immunity protein [Streptomyces sp. ACA25]